MFLFLFVILSERGPRRTLQPFRGPHELGVPNERTLLIGVKEQVFVRGVEVGGGESKDLLFGFRRNGWETTKAHSHLLGRCLSGY